MLEHDGAMHLVAQVFDFRVAHGRSLRLSAGARLSASGFSSPLPCPSTARRSRCKGARNAREPRDEPLSARPALAVAILFSFAHQAKVRRRWREQEIAAAVVGRLINGPWKADGSGTST
jgi:hypothetical protein